MRVAKLVGSVVAVLAAVIAFSSESRAGDEELVSVSCKDGAITATAKSPWHTNEKAPWKWDKGETVKVDEHAATFKGAKCEGTLRAYVCNGDQCKGPLSVPVK